MNPLKFIKGLFSSTKKKEDRRPIRLVDEVSEEHGHSFDLVLGFDVEPDPDGTLALRVNKLAFYSTNENGKKYIEMMDTPMLKTTIGALCIGASQHIAQTTRDFAKDVPVETEDELPGFANPKLEKWDIN